MKSMLRLVLVAILVSRELVSRVQAQKDPLKNTPSGKTSKVGTTKEPKRLISLAESMNITQRSLTDPDVLKIRRQYWEATLADIRKMTNYPSTTGSTTGSSMIGRGPKATVPPASPASIPSSTTTTAFSDEASSVSSSSNISLVDSTVRMEDKDGVSLSSTPTAANSLTSSRFESPRPAPPRFEGFPSWERMLQDWSEDIQDYVDQASEDSEAGYSMGNYGRPAASSWTETNNKTSWSFLSSPDTDQQQPLPLSPSLASSGIDLDNTASQPDESVNLTNKSLIVSKSKVSTSTPLSPIIITPEPLKEGEDVLPHTDLSDLSKRILIVTTASLPWKTGTAVNPLLRAAYLATPERSNAGGNVTLLVPWLERQDDQTRVYGASNTFETAEDQDTYIRTWLRDSAGMTHASTELNIAWYTAWQNKVENSIYSMGDITAIVSADEIDICILEEPEHLNWYRAPGESWTKKYKHVVGILHTNYFSYALDQPAALIRVRSVFVLVYCPVVFAWT